MEKITTKSEFLENIKDIHALEILAKENYEKDIITFKNFEIIQSITKVKIDEEKHIKMLEQVIELLQEE